MAYYKINLLANKDYVQETAGALILIDSVGVADGVDITPIVNGAEQTIMPMRKKAFRCVVKFDAVKFRAPVNCTIAVFLSTTDVSLGFAEGSEVTLKDSTIDVSNDDAAAIPVRNQALSGIIDYNTVAIPGTSAISLINDPDLRKLRFRNSHATAIIALGGASVTMADSPIQLYPGDAFIEEDGAGAHWYAITDTAGATLQLQGLKE